MPDCLHSCRSARNRSGIFLAGLTLLLSLMPGSTPVVCAQSASKPHRKVLLMVEPEYPPFMRSAHLEGQVRLDATVLPNGTVAKVESKAGNPMLAQFATRAVMKWKYAAGSNQTIEEVTIHFNPDAK